MGLNIVSLRGFDDVEFDMINHPTGHYAASVYQTVLLPASLV